MQFEILFVLLFAVATAVAILTRRLRMPYTVALVAAGLLLGSINLFTPPHLTKDLLYAVFLPGLVFEAAFHLEFKAFWASKVTIVSLAVPGVVAAIVFTALLLVPFTRAFRVAHGLGWSEGVVFGALLAATDPIAVVALFRSLGAPPRLGMLVEAESLLNDGTAVVFFTLVIAAIRGQVSLGGAVFDFARVVGAGAVIGVALGYGVSKIIQRIDDAMIEITLTTIAAYGSFALAESLHVSGIIATVVAGMVCGNLGATSMSPTTRIATLGFWDYVAFALNSVVFLLIGFEVRVREMLASWDIILVAWAAVTFGRALVIGITWAALRRTPERMPASWIAPISWGGIRGALAMVLALALPDDFPMRGLLLRMTFGVVVLSILLQGLTTSFVLRVFRVVTPRRVDAYQERRGDALAARAALDAIEQMRAEATVLPDVLGRLEGVYKARLDEAESDL
ncbi:MAG TPA: cation:proton antiporter, partial [Minicystis sp.]|nr:cation:proton antiporter [Minicystis sp.]